MPSTKVAAASQHVQRDVGALSLNFQCHRSSYTLPAEALSQDQPSVDPSAMCPLETDTSESHDNYVSSEHVQASLACGTSHGAEIETQVSALADELFQAGHHSSMDGHLEVLDIGKLRLRGKGDFDRAARAIISKVEGDPKYCEACACLSRALHVRSPSVSNQGITETFFHALLDVCQTDFEHLLFSSPEEKAGHRVMSPGRRNNQMSSIVRFAGHLYRQRMLGVQVVGSMVEDLLANHAVECARELLEFIGLSLDAYEHSLGTLVEDAVDAEGD
jgi:hypothetical protein